jgi:DNA repair exonuclease SbcCD ATPase subunit
MSGAIEIVNQQGDTMNDLLSPAPVADKGLKIVRLEAENLKRIQAIEITPDGHLVEITGRNAQGKSSILDAIWWAMKGRGAIQATPIRKGAEKAHIKLDLGEYVVTRTFNAAKDGPGFTTSVKVEAGKGFRAASPQQLLDGLMGDLSIDPLAFMRMEPKRQSDMLRGFVQGFDFDAHDEARAKLFSRRTEINRDAKAARAAAREVAVPSQLPAELVDEAALTAELASAGEHNASIERRRDRRATAAEQIVSHRSAAASIEAKLPAALEEIEASRVAQVARLQQRIRELQVEIDLTDRQAQTAAERAQAAAEAQAGAEREGADALQAQLDAADVLPEPVGVADLQRRIAEAREANAGIRLRALRDRQIENAERLEADAAALTAQMEAADKRRAEAIATAKLPVGGIEFGDGALLLHGVPLDQASDAEQLRVSVAIAMSLHPKLRVIRVRDGNVLDADGMKLLAELAAQNDCQVWVETVRHDDRIAFVIEDGRLKQAEAAGEAA